MTQRPMTLVAATTLAFTLACCGCSRQAPPRDELAVAAISPDFARAEGARAELRAIGPEGLATLLAQHEELIAICHADPPGPDGRCPVETWTRVRAAVEFVAQQRDATRSGLFWFTDLEAAKAAAIESGRPIISLRLLGRLNEEFTCANSRFFRTVLYANSEVSRTLREDYVLHWESVRPVPKVTIDFGDGRTMTTTLTGNSVHYLLSSEGRPIDVMPGLVGAGRFGTWLTEAGAFAQRLSTLPETERAETLAEHHRLRLAALETELAEDLSAVTAPGASTAQPPGTAFSPTGNGNDITFSTGSFVSYPDGTKTNVEMPIMRGLIPDTEALDQWFESSIWSEIAERHASEVELDQRSRDLAQWKSRASGDHMLPLFESLQRSVAEEMVRTEFIGHRAVHRWFVRGEVTDDLDALTERLYRDVFGLPVNDGWLGLVPPDAYRGIDDNGLSG